jgi:predicted RNase H-like HicB family nuclease
MKNDFIPYEQALALKELGFDEPCFGGYYSNQDNVNLWFFKEAKNSDRDERVREGFATAPTYSQAFRWFREKHGLRHFIEYDYGYYIALIQPPLVYSHGDTYEEAELACLKKLIEISTETNNPQTKP